MDIKTKHRKLMTLLSKAGFDEKTRHDLVFAWTDGRTSSSKELFENELDDLLWKINNERSFAANPQQTANAMMELAIKQKRSNVLAIAQRCDLHTGTDFIRFNSFMENHSILKKRLNKYTFEELDDLIKQMHQIEANYLESAKKAGTKAWYKYHGIEEPGEN